MTDDAVLVRMTVCHAEVLAQLQADCFPEDAWSTASIARLLADPAVTGLLLCEDGDEPVGFVVVRTAADEGELLTVGVRSDRRGRGHGRRLIAAARAAAAARGAERLFLEVSEGNAPALAMYRSAGFEPVGRRRHYYGVGSDALVLRLDTVPNG